MQDRWKEIFRLLSLPDEPHVLLAAPGDEREFVDTLLAVYPRARVSAIDVARRSIEGTQRPEGGVSRRYAAMSPNFEQQLPPTAFDVAIFDHALDDIVVEAIARNEGLAPDDAAGEYAPRPRAVRAYWRCGDLETVARPAFLSVLNGCSRALKPQSLLVLHHRVLNADLVDGMPMDLYTEYVELARKWTRGSSLGLREVSLDSLDSHWWLCLTTPSSSA